MSHVWLQQPVIVLWSRVNFINKDINVCCVSTPVCLPQGKSSSECSRSRHKNRVYSDTNGAMLSTGDRVSNRLHTHVINTGRCKNEIWVVTFFPSCTVERFRQFRILNECSAVRLCPLYNCYTVVICVVVAPYGVVAVEISDYNLG